MTASNSLTDRSDALAVVFLYLIWQARRKVEGDGATVAYDRLNEALRVFLQFLRNTGYNPQASIPTSGKKLPCLWHVTKLALEANVMGILPDDTFFFYPSFETWVEPYRQLLGCSGEEKVREASPWAIKAYQTGAPLEEFNEIILEPRVAIRHIRRPART